MATPDKKIRAMPRHEERALAEYFNGDKGPIFVTETSLSAPFYRKYPPVISRDSFYQDIRDLLSAIKKIQRQPNDPTSFVTKDLTNPYFDTWMRINNTINGALAGLYLSALEPDTTIIHRRELDNLLRKKVANVAKSSFALYSPQIKQMNYFGSPGITTMNKEGEITGFVDEYSHFNPNQPFPQRHITNRVAFLKSTIENPKASQVFIEAVRELQSNKGIDTNPGFSPNFEIKSILVRSSDPNVIDNLRQAGYDKARATGYARTRTTTYLTLRKIADDFSPALADWHKFYL